MQVKQLGEDEDCDAGSMGGGEFRDTEFEIVAQAYFWEVYSGCICPSGKFAESKRETCLTEEL